MRVLFLLLLTCLPSAAQNGDPAHDPLEKAYQALRAGDDRQAVEWFQKAIQRAPSNASIHKDLGYTYLRVGEEQSARRMFEQALVLDPADEHTALELGFACQRAGENGQAAKIFESLAERADGEVRRTAQRALQHLRQKGRETGTANPADPAGASLQRAYEALAAKDYEAAIHHFQTAITQAPARASLRKELGYAYIKIGETAWARDLFEQAVQLNPEDHRAALELAFLHYETGQPAQALRLLRTLSETTSETTEPETRRTAEAVYKRIDAELRQAIGRWKEAVAMDPLNRSAQLELAGLYEKRGEPEQAVAHYLAAWLIPSEQPREEILLQLARAREAAGDREGAVGAWLLASRSGEPRIAETAREKLPGRYPWASEFRRALELDPRNTRLRRELAYLQLEVGNLEEARKEFEIVCRDDPNDLLAAAQLAFVYLERSHPAEAVELLERARQSSDPELARRAAETLRRTREGQAQPHRDLGDRSLKKSYLRDAEREFLRAYELNPADYGAALKLGVVLNLMKRDREALRWFRLASASPDPAIAEQASQSYRNLAPQFRRFTTTLWTLPMFSSRFHDLFQYSQIKTEMGLGRIPLRPYVSLRFIGDLRQRTAETAPQFLSESSLIAGFGLRTPTRRGLTLWGEAGTAFSYLDERPPGVPRAGPDYRGGLNWFRSFGATLGGGRPGAFSEINADGVYVSRFDDNMIGYWQFRSGYRLPARGALQALVYWNFNLTLDRNRAYWANFVELGPGIRLRIPRISPPMDLSVHFLRGVHLVNDFNPRRPNYYDLRIALWYSFAR